MKCKHCGKDIPSYKTTCPYCHWNKYAARSPKHSSYNDDNRTSGSSYSRSSYSDNSYSGSSYGGSSYDGDSFGGGSSDGGGASGGW